MNTQVKKMQHEDRQDSSFELAIAVLQEQIGRIKGEDREDLSQLLPYLFSEDVEESQEARKAVMEIIDQKKGQVIAIDKTLTDNEECAKWVSYVGDKVKEERQKRNWNQETLAEKAGLQQAHISKIENKIHSPNRKTLEKLAVAFELPFRFFDPTEED